MVRNYLPLIAIPINGKLPGSFPPTSVGGVGRTDNQIDALDELQDGEEVSYSDKLRFSQRIKNLSQEDLGKIVSILQSSCPDAFK